MQLSFDQILADCDHLAKNIRASGFSPDFIVGITRGGWIPSRLLSSALKVKKILSIGLMYTDASRTNLDAYQIPNPMPLNEKLLIVEDCLESGFSLYRAAQIFHDQGNAVKTAALYITDKTIYPADFFYARHAVAPKFPWEKS
jgi:hypoxanthine phosphoribosyltransferase